MSDVNVKDALDAPSRLPLSAVTGALAAFVYVSGYLVHAFYTRGKGIPSLPLLNAEYIHTGLVFLGLTTFIIVLPAVIWRAVVKAHKRSKTPVMITAVITPFVAATFLYLVLFYALFITHSDWAYTVRIFNHNVSLQSLSLVYFISVGLLLCLIPAIRQFNTRRNASDSRYFSDSIDNASTSTACRVAVMFLQALEVAVTVVFLFMLWRKLPWVAPFIGRLVFYVLSLLVVFVSAKVIVGWTNVYQWKGLGNLFLLIGLPFFVAAYLILISTYAFGVYNNLPVNRGGRHPVTSATLVVEHDYVLPPEYIASTETQYVISRRVYILEESESYLYIAQYKDPAEWFGDAPTVRAIRKDAVLRMDLQSIMDGKPRM